MTKMMRKISACLERMYSMGINGEGRFRGQLVNLALPGKVSKNDVCVYVCHCLNFQLLFNLPVFPRLLHVRSGRLKENHWSC